MQTAERKQKPNVEVAVRLLVSTCFASALLSACVHQHSIQVYCPKCPTCPAATPQMPNPASSSMPADSQPPTPATQQNAQQAQSATAPSTATSCVLADGTRVQVSMSPGPGGTIGDAQIVESSETSSLLLPTWNLATWSAVALTSAAGISTVIAVSSAALAFNNWQQVENGRQSTMLASEATVLEQQNQGAIMLSAIMTGVAATLGVAATTVLLLSSAD